MEVFKKNTVLIRDPVDVEEKVSLLIKGGAAKLQVIADFDYTITRTHLNGNQCQSTFGVLETCSFISDENKYQANLLFEHYYPFETDPHLTVEEKIPYMNEWYTKMHNLMAGYGIKKENIREIVRMSSAALRDGCDKFFHMLHAHVIPLLIFSAGVGDILKEILKQQDLLFPNMKIISNFMKFNEQGILTGFENDLIHTFNKNQSSMENSEYFEHLKVRNNIILLGDSLGDSDMSKVVQDTSCILKIGFLNKKVEENLPKYLKVYDVVLADDQTMDVVNGLLQSIL